MLEVKFAVTRPGDVEQELTQKDQFDTDKVPLPATLVRESLQNTGDARSDTNSGAVRVRIAFHQAGESEAVFLQPMFKGLVRHLNAVGVPMLDLDFLRPDFLTIEDFGTTGLTGSLSAKDDQPFSDFWRRIGRSHKRGNQGGSWGLGKLVFPFSSRIYTVLGMTVQEGLPDVAWLMGQTILSTHKIDGCEHVLHGFIANFGDDDMPVPTSDPGVIDAFRRATGITRISEPGLSLAIPLPRDELKAETLIPLVIEHYFFPILTGQLEVTVNEELISSETVNDLLQRFPSKALRKEQIGFIRELHAARTGGTSVVAGPAWLSDWKTAFDDEQLSSLRAAYATGKLIHVNVPMAISRRDGRDVSGAFDLFLKVAPAGSEPSPLFVRGAITVPGEAKQFTSRTTFGALIASEGAVAEFLRDAENPAHTGWNGRAEKLNRNWISPAAPLSAIRYALRGLNQLLENTAGISDPDALIDLLNIRQASSGPKRPLNPVVRKPIVDIEPKPARYRLKSRKGGFSIVAGPGLGQADLPLKLMVRCGYAVARGNAIKRWDRNDFTFDDETEISLEAVDMAVSGKGNRLALKALGAGFCLEASGFDRNRDLLVSISEVQE